MITFMLDLFIKTLILNMKLFIIAKLNQHLRNFEVALLGCYLSGKSSLVPSFTIRKYAITKAMNSGILRQCLLAATSHKRLRARDHYTSSTLIGEKGGAGPSLLPTTLEGPTEYVNARMM